MNKSLLILVFAIAGVIFSGFLSVTSLFLGFCPLNEGCPLILGLPACLYGLGLFTAILILHLLKKNVKYLALAGVALAVYSTILELLNRDLKSEIVCTNSCSLGKVADDNTIFGMRLSVQFFFIIV